VRRPGPHQDDITRDVIAEVMGVELRRDPELEERIRAMFESRFRTMPENNLRQADVPEGASLIAQMPGTAPGLVCPVPDPADPDGPGKVIFAVPGVPYEMQEMVAGTVIPELRRRSGDLSSIRSRVLRTWGQSESGLAEQLAPYHEELEASGHCTLAWLASGMEGLKLRLTAKAATEAEADAILEREVALLQDLLGDLVFSVDDEPMEQVILDLCRAQGLTLATAESVTGGLIASRLTNIPGASDVFRGSVVSYASEVKFDVLGVPRPVISEEAAVAIAEARATCSAPTSRCRSPASPGPSARRASPWARCSWASPSAARPRRSTCASPVIASASASSPRSASSACCARLVARTR
jgi:nicotinamide-nucleotide amidase